MRPEADTLLLFGAGHVGKALVSVLADLPFRVRWIDEREDEFPADLPANVHILVSDRPAEAVATAPAGRVLSWSPPTAMRLISGSPRRCCGAAISPMPA